MLNLTGERPAHRIAPNVPDEGLQAFFVVPFVAALAWYGCMMVQLFFVNGRLRLRTDLLAIGVGTLILGLPVAAAITVAVALPLYLVVARLGRASLLSAGLGGLAIGAAASLVAHLLDQPSLMPAWAGPVVGCTSAFAWWRAAGKPQSASAGPDR